MGGAGETWSLKDPDEESKRRWSTAFLLQKAAALGGYKTKGAPVVEAGMLLGRKGTNIEAPKDLFGSSWQKCAY